MRWVVLSGQRWVPNPALIARWVFSVERYPPTTRQHGSRDKTTGGWRGVQPLSPTPCSCHPDARCWTGVIQQVRATMDRAVSRRRRHRLCRRHRHRLQPRAPSLWRCCPSPGCRPNVTMQQAISSARLSGMIASTVGSFAAETEPWVGELARPGGCCRSAVHAPPALLLFVHQAIAACMCGFGHGSSWSPPCASMLCRRGHALARHPHGAPHQGDIR